LQVASRYLTHVLVLVSAIFVPMLSLSGLKAHTSSPVISAFSADRTESAGRGFILKPAAAATLPAQKRAIQTYSVHQGDTLWALSDRFGINIDTIRWANGLSDVDTLALDQKLLLPPIDGVLVSVKAGETLAQIAAKYKSTSTNIIEYNLIRDPDHLAPGTQLMIPDGVGAGLPAKPAAPKAAVRASGPVQSVVRYSGGGGSSAHFPWGYCTWYVATKRYVPWNGDAHAWYGNAQAYGFPTGKTPQVGAIMVTWESWWGHVAYVEAVDGACWTVSEMNYRGFGIVSYRHICPGQVPLIGFVY
jgi:surface antigen/LysM repeat protein